MRSFLLYLALSAGALGILAMSPGEAKAFPPVGMSGFRNMGFGRTFSFGMPTVQTQTNSSMVTRTIMSPGSVRTLLTPTGVERLFFGPSTKTVTLNSATGAVTTTSTNPSVTKILFTPYADFRRLNTPRVANFPPLIRTPNLGVITGFENTAGIGMGTWHGMSWPMMNISMLGTGGLMSFPMINMSIAASMSGEHVGTGPDVLGSNRPAASPSNADSSVADAYKDYLPPGYIK